MQWKITKENVKNFPIQYVLDRDDGEGDFELGNNEETMKLFERYDYLVINSSCNLYGYKGNTSFDLLIDNGKDGELSDEDMKALTKKCYLMCPDCGSPHIVKDGPILVRNGGNPKYRQTYKCNQCGRKFTSEWYIDKVQNARLQH